jgi:hypothetical protein
MRATRKNRPSISTSWYPQRRSSNARSAANADVATSICIDSPVNVRATVEGWFKTAVARPTKCWTRSLCRGASKRVQAGNQAELSGLAGGVHASLDAELAIDVAEVELDRRLREPQLTSDHTVARAGGDV